MRVSTLVLVVALIACASSAPSTSGGAEGNVRVRAEGNRSILSMNAAPVAGVSVIATGIDKAWSVLPAVYDSLAIPRSRIDQASYTIGNTSMQLRRRLGKVRLSKYLDCGTTQQGLGADDNDVNLSVTTQLQAEPTGATRVTTIVSALSKPTMLSGDYSRCSSTGEIEREVHFLLDAAVQK